MGNFFIIRNKEKNMYYWGDGIWTKIKDCARKHQHKDCAETLIYKDNLDHKNCEVVEIPSIADLESKLAQSEKKQEYLFSSICEYVSQIEELKQQLAEKNELFIIKKWKVDDLEKQLAEKEKEIEELRFRERNINGLIEQLPNQNQTAIAELEKVLNNINYNTNCTNEGCVPYNEIEEIIDQQIKSLKGEK